MERVGTFRSRPRRANGALVLGLALCLTCAWPKSAPAVPGGDLPKSVMEEFRDICGDLSEARERLAAGRMDEQAFADTLLSLFIRADSLAEVLAAGPRGNPARITLQRGTAYLIDSLRENWLGISARNGMSFAEADVSLKAAVAWRSNATEASASP